MGKEITPEDVENLIIVRCDVEDMILYDSDYDVVERLDEIIGDYKKRLES